MGSGEVAIVALSTMISLKVTFSDGLGGARFVKAINPVSPIQVSIYTERRAYAA